MPIVNDKKMGAPDKAASEKKKSSSRRFEGNVVSITGDKLVMTSKEGKEYTHTLAKDARLSRDGTDCEAKDLKAGCRIRVTTKKDDRNVVTGIECLDENAEIARCS